MNEADKTFEEWWAWQYYLPRTWKHRMMAESAWHSRDAKIAELQRELSVLTRLTGMQGRKVDTLKAEVAELREALRVKAEQVAQK